MINKSKYLMRANVALTSNVKLVVDTKYNLYLESYNSNDLLSDNKYKKFRIKSDEFLSERLAHYYKDLPVESAFEVRDDVANDRVQLKYEDQYDDIYFSGALNIEYNKYEEEFQYNTTLKIVPESLPKYFFIFRLNGSGIDVHNNNDIMNSINDAKLIHTTDMNYYTNFGKFLNKNYLTDDKIPVAPFELNINAFEFSKWHGYNYTTGGTAEKSVYLDDFIRTQDTDYALEKYIIEGFKKHEIISSNYLNVCHLFNDTNAKVFISSNYNSDPNIYYNYFLKDYPFLYDMFNKKMLNKNDFEFKVVGTELKFRTIRHVIYRDRWSINRYMGLYSDDLIEITKISPHISTEIKTDDNIIIIDNIFYDDITGAPISPLKNDYSKTTPVYLKINNNYFLIEKTVDKNGDIIYHIVADKLYNGYLKDFLNNAEPAILIEYDNPLGIYKNYLKKINHLAYDNELLNQYYDNYGKILLIKILDEYYKLNKDSYGYYINTDNILSCNKSEYIKKSLNAELVRNIKILNKEQDMIFFNIYLINFTEIEDFDFTHQFTTHANYEYETTLLTNNTEFNNLDPTLDLYNKSIEHKINRPIFFNYDITTAINNKVKTYSIYSYILMDLSGNKAHLFDHEYILPASSEYAANGDLYMLEESELSDIWNINQYVNKFGFAGSNDVNSIPYKLNNSLMIWNQNNKGFDINEKHISIFGHNLDWFYTFGTPFRMIKDIPLEDIDKVAAGQVERYAYEYYRTLNIDYHNYNFSGDTYIRQNIIPFNYDNYLLEYRFDYLTYFLNEPAHINTNTNLTPNILFKNVNRFAQLNRTDYSKGSLFYYKGLSGYIRYNELDDYNDINSKNKTYIANDLSNYKMTALVVSRETTDTMKYGKAGIDFVLNKYHNHFLICVYIYVPEGQLINLEFSKRDLFYESNDYIKYSVDPGGGAVYKNSELKIEDITLYHIYDIMLHNLSTYSNFSDGIHYKILEPNEEYEIVNINSTIITLNKEHHYKQNDTISINNVNYKILDKVDNFKIEINSGPYAVGDIIKYATSKKPFIFEMRPYNRFNINEDVNISNVNNAKLMPYNSNKLVTNNNEIIVDKYSNKLLPIYNDDNMVYTKYIKIQNIDNIGQNFINRYSGFYEPITSRLNLFDNIKLKKFISTTFVALNITGNDAYFILPRTTMNFNYIPNILKDNLLIYIENIKYIISIKNMEFDTNGDFKITISDLGLSNINIQLFFKYTDNININLETFNAGIINELIISKVDPNMECTRDIRLIYPYLDEHGNTSINKNVFLSNWEDSYFKIKKKNKYNLI